MVKLYEFEKNNENLDDEEWEQYREEVKWLAEKVDAI
jgi:hypothetical protein